MEALIIILILLAIVMALVGIIGAIVPAIPGPPLSFASLFIAYLATGCISTSCLVWMLVLTILATILDYIAPIWLTKLGGGSKKAIWGSTIGTIIGLFFMPWGLIVGPLVGAFLGEMMHKDEVGKALKVALMSFIAFLLTTGLKLTASLLMTYFTFKAIWDQGAEFIMNHLNRYIS